MDSYYMSLAKGQAKDNQEKEMSAREYANSLLKNYMVSIGARKEDIAARKRAISEMAPDTETSLTNVNLKPLAGFVDAITGSRMAQSYDAPPSDFSRNEMILKLRNAISKDEAGLIDDELNAARLLNEDNRLRDKMSLLDENKDQDRLLKERLAGNSLFAKQQMADKKQAAKANQEKLVPASAAENLADLRSQMNSVNKIKDEWNSMMGPVGGVTDYLKKNLGSRIPNTNEAKYRSSLKQKAQTIGKALEGGKLTDVDYEKYIHFLPQPGDTEEMAQQRITNLTDALQNAYNTRLQSYNQVGYSTGVLPQLKSQPPKSARVRVTNGSEILEIDRNDLQDAMKDGYKEVK